MDDQKLSGLIGLCMRARQLVLGTDMALKAVRGGKAAVILMDEGASELPTNISKLSSQTFSIGFSKIKSNNE